MTFRPRGRHVCHSPEEPSSTQLSSASYLLVFWICLFLPSVRVAMDTHSTLSLTLTVCWQSQALWLEPQSAQ
eukprot:2726227-Amphidinium_carterae.1